MTTTKLTKDQQAIVDFCESHEGLTYEIEVDDSFTSFHSVRLLATVEGLEWHDAKTTISLTAFYSVDSKRPRQMAHKSWHCITRHEITELKVREALREVNTMWKYNTSAGKEAAKAESDFYKNLAASYK